PLDDPGGGRRAHVGVDQRLLEPLPGLVVERLEHARLQLGAERLAALRHVLAQAVEEAAPALGFGLAPVRLWDRCVGDEQLAPGLGHGGRIGRRKQRAEGRGQSRYAAATSATSSTCSSGSSRRDTTLDTPSPPMLTP